MRLLPAACIITALTVAGGAQSGYAQRVLLRSNTRQDTVRATYGPNRAFFQHLYLSYVPIVGDGAAGAKIKAFSSAEYSVGLRQKYRLSSHLATGFDIRYTRLNYALAQTFDKVLPNGGHHDSEALVLHQFLLDPYVRLNFGRRGNVVGHYLDLVGWAGWVAGTVHTFEDRPGGQGASRTIVHERGLSYVRRWPAGVGARLGSNRYAAVMRYRLTNSFTNPEATLYPELPQWSAGLEIGLF